MEIFCSTRLTLIPIESKSALKVIIEQEKERSMGIKNLKEDVILVDLSSEGQRRSEELKAVNEVVSNKNDSDVIMDFSRVEIVNSWDISNLLILQNLLSESGRKLILSSVKTVTRCIFVVAGLAEAFNFTDNRSEALEAVGKADSRTNTPLR